MSKSFMVEIVDKRIKYTDMFQLLDIGTIFQSYDDYYIKLNKLTGIPNAFCLTQSRLAKFEQDDRVCKINSIRIEVLE